MSELAHRFRGQGGLVDRALNQAARELMLAQSSDWAFIMHTGTVVPYAVARTKEHVFNFTEIYEMLTENRLNEGRIRELEERDCVFPDMNYEHFCYRES